MKTLVIGATGLVGFEVCRRLRESGAQVPTLPIIEAIGSLTGTDPGWISHGSRTAAPGPRTLEVAGLLGNEITMADSREILVDRTRRERPIDPETRV